MPQTLPSTHRDLFDGTPFAALVTLGADGAPSMCLTWCDYDGEYLLVNVKQDDVHARNAAADPRIALLIVDCANPYRYLEVGGRVVEVTGEGAEDQIDLLARKYLGQDRYPFRDAEELRVVLRIAIDAVVKHG